MRWNGDVALIATPGHGIIEAVAIAGVVEMDK